MWASRSEFQSMNVASGECSQKPLQLEIRRCSKLLEFLKAAGAPAHGVAECPHASIECRFKTHERGAAQIGLIRGTRQQRDERSRHLIRANVLRDVAEVFREKGHVSFPSDRVSAPAV